MEKIERQPLYHYWQPRYWQTWLGIGLLRARSQALEPMPAYERRLVHISLRNHPQVATQSVGEGEKRKVTIFPKA